ncbi:wd repeat and hmg-box DNA binding protein [Anaeramoeba ignava]|uniref:Wd repeat and hmg-box DNA binding protein n=1 Tax=Anaeramoeba ignava TaxID=1746090 RepID=A0A9Q0LXF7_ANAIG|nr:wd repeat and hmg-box DNA binding protein [Anaeramoeba ignava]
MLNQNFNLNSQIEWNNVHEKNASDILLNISQKHILTCNLDGSLKSFHLKNLKNSTNQIKLQSGIQCFALSKNSQIIACGTKNSEVHLYNSKDLSYHSTLARKNLPINSIDFDSNSQNIIMSFNETKIRIINIENPKEFKEISSFESIVSKVAYDPKGKYFSTTEFNGTTQIFTENDLKSIQKFENNSKHQFSSNGKFGAIWSPTGDFICVPDLENNCVNIVSRDSWEKIKTIKKPSKHTFLILGISIDSKYIATLSEDQKEITIWKIRSGKEINHFAHNTKIVGFGWGTPKSKTCYILDCNGKLGTWKNVLEKKKENKKKKKKKEKEIEKKKEKEIEKNIEEEVVEDSDNEYADLDAINVSEDETVNVLSDGDDIDDIDDIEMDSDNNGGGEYDFEEVTNDNMHEIFKRIHQITNTKKWKEWQNSQDISQIMKPFQTSSTPFESNTRRYLAWNMTGSIISIDEEELSILDVEFNDQTRHRSFRLNNRNNVGLATLSHYGVLFAGSSSQNDQEDSRMDLIQYKPLNQWPTNEEWRLSLDSPESAVSIACAKKFIAVATNLNFLRLFSSTGREFFVLSIPGPILSIVSNGENLLSVVYGNETHNLKFQLLDMETRSKIHESLISISPKSKLAWIGFSSSNLFSTFDSLGILRVLSNNWFGYQFIPVLDSRKFIDQKDGGKYWPIGLSSNEFYGILLSAKDTFPSAMKKPIITSLKLSVPISGQMEDSDLLQELILEKVMESKEQFNSDPQKQKTRWIETDSLLVRQYDIYCKTRNNIKAWEVCKEFHFQKSLGIALLIASKTGLNELAEKIEKLILKKKNEEKQILNQNSNQNSNQNLNQNSNQILNENPNQNQNQNSNENLNENENLNQNSNLFSSE